MKGKTVAATDEESTDGDLPTLVSRRQFVIGAAATGAALAAGPGSVTAEGTEWTSGRDLDFSTALVGNPYFEEDALTRAKHLAEWGLTLADLDQYEDDSGEVARLGGFVPKYDPSADTETENVVTLRADKIDFPAASAFPRGQTWDHDADTSTDEEDVTALDAAHWTTTNATTGSISVTDADLAVSNAITIASSSLADTETVTATFDLTANGSEITSDVLKRFMAGVVNVNSIGANAVVDLVAIDNDGDEKKMSVDPAGDASTAGVIATATGNGIVFQQRLQDLTTGGAGDGAFDSIQKVEVRISAAGGASDASVTFTALDLEKKGLLSFGEYVANEGTDSETTETYYRPSGAFSIKSLDTLGSVVGHADTVFYDVKTPFRFTMEDSAGSYEYRFVPTSDYSGYDYILETRGEIEAPAGIDLAHTALTLKEDVSSPGLRYTDVWTAENVEGTEFADLTDSQKRSHTSLFDSQGTTAELDASVTAGQQFKHFEAKIVTEDEKSAVVKKGGGAPPSSAESASSWVLATILGGVTALLGFVAYLRRGV